MKTIIAGTNKCGFLMRPPWRGGVMPGPPSLQERIDSLPGVPDEDHIALIGHEHQIRSLETVVQALERRVTKINKADVDVITEIIGRVDGIEKHLQSLAF